MDPMFVVFIVAAGLAIFPAYAWLVARLSSHAYFVSKLEYQAGFMQNFDPTRSANGLEKSSC